MQLRVIAGVSRLAVGKVEEEHADQVHSQVRVNPGLTDRTADRALERDPRHRHRVTMRSCCRRAGGERHLRDHRRAALGENQVIVRVRLPLHADEPGLHPEGPPFKRAAGVLAARTRPERSEIANRRRAGREVELPRLGVGKRLDWPTLDSADRPSNRARRLVLRSGSDPRPVPLARDQPG